MPRSTPTSTASRTTAPATREQPADESAPPTRAQRSRSRAARVAAPVALGSLTQAGSRGGEVCGRCGSARITSLSMTLTDGTPVRFTSCHTCEHRTWRSAAGELGRDDVLSRTRKIT